MIPLRPLLCTPSHLRRTWDFVLFHGLRPLQFTTAALSLAVCVPAGNSTPTDSGAAPMPSAAAKVRQAPNVLRTVFEDNFDRPSAVASASAKAPAPSAAPSASGGPPAPSGSAAVEAPNALGPNWYQSQTNVWHIENGRLCAQNAHNHGVWLQRPIPINARIEFDAISDTAEGDLKAEVWGDGQSSAKGISYNDATSYLAIFGGWKNTYHVLARMNEHGTDRKELRVEKDSDNPRLRQVIGGRVYHFKIERTDGKTVRWYVDDLEYLSYPDANPLAGIGHDHFGFNDWEVKVCFDNVKITPL